MQPIYILNRREFTLEGRILTYDCYFIDTPTYRSKSTQETFKKVLSRWASALSGKREDGQVFIFPFAPDDEWTDALKGTIDGSSIIITPVTLCVPGFGIDFENLEDFIISPEASFPELLPTDLIQDVEESMFFELTVDTEEFIEKLRNVRIIDGNDNLSDR